MQLEVGSIVEGKVVTITKFGAFVDIGDKTGMVHISEVASTFVQDIHDFLTEGQQVTVKVLAISPEGKISLSVKQAAPAPTGKSPRPDDRGPRNAPRPDPRSKRPRSADRDYSKPARAGQSEPGSFEDMMSRFKSSSDDKMGELKKRTNTGAAPRPRGGRDRKPE